VPAELLLQEQEEAVEKERTAAAARVREACERYESQMQVWRVLSPSFVTTIVAVVPAVASA